MISMLRTIYDVTQLENSRPDESPAATEPSEAEANKLKRALAFNDEEHKQARAEKKFERRWEKVADGQAPLERHDQVSIIHHHIERNETRVAFKDELEQYSNRSGAITGIDYRLVSHYTETEARPSAESIVDSTADWKERDIYVCGPQELIADVVNYVQKHEAGKPVHYEHFSLDRAHPGQGGVVHFGHGPAAHDESSHVEVDGATTILEAEESIGVNLPHGCRMGVCSTCVMPLSKGHATDLRTGELYEPGQRIKTCSSAPAGECTIDIGGPVNANNLTTNESQTP